MKKIYTTFLALALPFALLAQDAGSIVRKGEIELTNVQALWFNSSNSAGMGISPLNNYSIVGMGYQLESGDFKMTQTGEDLSTVRFNTEGTANFSDIYLWGAFNYENTTQKNTAFVTNVYDPYRDMPYYIADNNLSKWKKQEYDLHVRAAFPQLWNFLTAGGEVKYTTRTGAKQNDPRSVAYYLTVSASPSFVFELNEKNNLGLSLNYEYLFERSTNNRSDTEINYPVYVMKGLGNYTTGLISGSSGLGTFFYKGNKIGAGVQYGWQSDGACSLLAEAKYSYKVEDAFQTPTKKQNMGSTKQNFWSANLQLLGNGADYLNKVTLSYTDKNTDGVEYLQELDTSFEVSQWVTLAKYVKSKYSYKALAIDYDIFRKRGSGYNWRAGLNAGWSEKFDEYLLPYSYLKAENVLVNVYGKKDFRLSGRSNLLAGVNIGYNANLGGEYNYSGPYADEPTVTQMYANDVLYLSADYVKFGGELCFSTLVGAKTSMFVEAKCQYYAPGGSEFNKRLFADFSVGITF